MTFLLLSFYSTRFSIHDTEKVNQATTANSQDRETNLPPKPRSLLEDAKVRNFYPITWRVIGGGVMMGEYSVCSAVNTK